MSTTTTVLTASQRCPTCGSLHPNVIPQQPTPDLLRAQSRIAELEAQVSHLKDKAAAAVSSWQDYEAQLRCSSAPKQPVTPLQQDFEAPVQQSPLQQGTWRLSSLLSPRKSNLRRGENLPLSPGTASTEDLMEALTREQMLRREAEGRLSATSKEVEELSVCLFEQANEMVADERRARARLEERVGELERRDKEKRRRLERLEGAMERIEKARLLLEED